MIEERHETFHANKVYLFLTLMSIKLIEMSICSLGRRLYHRLIRDVTKASSQFLPRADNSDNNDDQQHKSQSKPWPNKIIIGTSLAALVTYKLYGNY